MKNPGGPSAPTNHISIWPVVFVAKSIEYATAVELESVWTPSVMENDCGVSKVNGKLSGNGAGKVSVIFTLSDVVYGNWA
jgi:hypothetical protein